jgi:molecular chaperone GrpE
MGKKTKIKLNKGSEPEVNEEILAEEPEISAEDAQEEKVTLTKAEFDELNKALEEAKKKEQENYDAWIRERADFTNYKKRMDRDQDLLRSNYKSGVLEKFIPVLDDLELAYQHRPEEGEASSWAEGIELIIRKFNSLLENDGLTKIDVKAGDKLDPNIHLAVSSEDSDEYGSDEIIEVLQNGYRMGDKIVRPAMVRVAR